MLDLATPVVMGIVNVTPDSFYPGSRTPHVESAVIQCEKHINEGATILDIGAMSSRPGAKEISADEEIDRLVPVVEAIRKAVPDAIISVDVYRSKVAGEAMNAGAHIINDIGGGLFDPEIVKVAAEFNAPYILMHNRVKSENMTLHADYEDLMKELLQFFYNREHEAARAGITDIVLDPGLGFSKKSKHGFEILSRLDELKIVGRPILVGLSRKSFIYHTLDIDIGKALNGTTAMHMVALQKGANILRVHDVMEAVECVKLNNKLQEAITRDEE